MHICSGLRLAQRMQSAYAAFGNMQLRNQLTHAKTPPSSGSRKLIGTESTLNNGGIALSTPSYSFITKITHELRLT